MPAHRPGLYSHTCGPGFTYPVERGDRHRGRGKERENTGLGNWLLGTWPVSVLQGWGKGEEERYESWKEGRDSPVARYAIKWSSVS